MRINLRGPFPLKSEEFPAPSAARISEIAIHGIDAYICLLGVSHSGEHDGQLFMTVKR